MDPGRFPSLRAQFAEAGYAYVPAFLSPRELEEARANVDRYIREVVPRLDSFRALYDAGGGERAVKQLADMDKDDPWFRAMLHESHARSLACALLGEDAVPQMCEYFDKAPRIGQPTPAHQDGYYFCLEPNHAVTLWIGLDDFDAQNGCMQYVPGSHLNGVLEHRASGVVGFSQGMEERAYSPAETFVARGSAGDCYAHHSLMIHLAGANRSDRHRRSIGLVYYGASARRDEAAHARYRASVAAQRQAYPADTVNAAKLAT